MTKRGDKWPATQSKGAAVVGEMSLALSSMTQIAAEAKILASCKPEGYNLQRRNQLFQACVEQKDPKDAHVLRQFGLLSNGGGYHVSSLMDPALSVARLANQAMQSVLPDAYYHAIQMRCAENCNSVQLRAGSNSLVNVATMWLLAMHPHDAYAVWTSLCPGDQVVGQVHCQDITGVGIVAGHMSPVAAGVPVCLSPDRHWKLCSAPEMARAPVLLAHAAPASLTVPPDLQLQLITLGFPVQTVSKPLKAGTECQGESPSVSSVSKVSSISLVSKVQPMGEEPDSAIKAITVTSHNHALQVLSQKQALELGPGLAEELDGFDLRPRNDAGRWFTGIPLPAAELVEPHLRDYLDKEEESQSLDGTRLMLLAAARDQETALTKEIQSGAPELSEDTARCLASINSMLHSLESELVELADDCLEGYEDEGPQNRDLRLAAVKLDEHELLQTRIVPIADVSANISEWRNALTDEAASLISEYGACRPITEMQSKG